LRGVLLGLCVAALLVVVGCGRAAEPGTLTISDGLAESTPALPPEPDGDDTAPEVVRPSDLGALALDLDELPARTGIDFERFVRPGLAVSGFRRNFAVQGRTLGESQPVELQTDVLLFPDEETSESVFLEIQDSFDGDTAADAFRRAFISTIGVEPQGLVGATETFADRGDGTVSAIASFDTRAGAAEGVVVITRVGFFHNILVVVTPENQLELDDVYPLVDSAVVRLQAEATRLRAEGGPRVPEAPSTPGERTT
jgi:hypothetical protein